MNWRRVAALLGTLVLVLSVLPIAAVAAPDRQNALAKVEPQVLDELNASGQTDYFIWLAEQADVSAADKLPNTVAKHTYVYETLVATAERTQRGLRSYLDGQSADYKTFYIVNAILVRGGNQPLLMALAARPEVAQITANHKFQLQEPFKGPDQGHTTAIEPNISFVNADDVWALGVTGVGVVVAGNDTGLDEAHPGIARHYRGCVDPPTCSTFDNNYNWWDATGTYPNDPWDGFGHGTHTTGTMVGDDGAGNQVGMAPGAKTIHCKNMTDGGSGSDDTFLTCFEWDLAPWDLNQQNPRPDLAPDSVNNSWGYWGGGQNQFRTAIDNLQTAGTAIEVSAGNEGSSCQTLRSPGDYQEVMTTGSINHVPAYPGTITGFSSRGPSSLDGDYFPDVMAPGENIRSTIPGGSYEGGWSGTSMAGPHVTALIGLIWSANPALRGQVDITYNIIRETAVPLTGQGGSNCGGDYNVGPNNDWGYGTIDALAAVEMARGMGGAGYLDGTVTDAASSNPLEGVTVNAVHEGGFAWSMPTDVDGYYTFTVAAGTFTVTVDAFGYYPEQVVVEVLTDTVTTQDFALDSLPIYDVSGTVLDAMNGQPVDAQVEVVGAPIPPVQTNPSTGFYTIAVPAGTYTFRVTAVGYAPAERAIVVSGNQTENFVLYGFCDVFTDTVENGNVGWTAGGSPNTWAITEESSNSPTHSWTDSPGGQYTNYNDNYIDSPILDLSDYNGITLSFWHTYQTESDYDYCLVEYSTDGGGSWNEAASWNGQNSGWEQVSLDLPELDGQANARIRFHFTSDISLVYDGWHVDDIVLSGGGSGCYPNQPPTAAFTSNSPVPDGQMAVFTNGSFGSQPLSYSWDLGDGTVVTETNPTHLYPGVGAYTVTLEVTNAFGSDTISDVFVVECGPVTNVDFDWTPITPTVGGTVLFTGTAAGTEPITYEWDLGDGTTAAGAGVSHAYTTPGDYTVVMTATNCGGQTATASYVVTVLCDPVSDADFTWSPITPTVGEVVQFNGAATGTLPISFDWDFGDDTIGTGSNPTHTYSAAGVYTVTMMATNCDGDWVGVSYQVTVICDEMDDAAFNWLPATPAVGEAVDFTAVITGGTAPFSFAWDFGDDGTGTGITATHSYTATGSYTVSLTVTDACGTMTVEAVVVVEEAEPTAYTVFLPIVLKGYQP